MLARIANGTGFGSMSHPLALDLVRWSPPSWWVLGELKGPPLGEPSA